MNEVIDAVAEVADRQNARVIFSRTAKGAVVAGVGALIGGLLGGRIGMVIGTTVGTIGATMLSPGTQEDTRAVGDYIRLEITPNQRQILYDFIVKAVLSVLPVQVAAIASILLNALTPELWEAVSSAIQTFLTNINMRMVMA